ncbi:TetR/AcrR family transcriptional regulator [Gordonia polyisoprenivorans]|uniref:TetR/AcrR family transcriptional regulator n=1 Tax=Gordonia polyisoprenivorans TaxID=84595 RepID=UPI002301B70F|nr:TetR/AcrR family transcriptional regulator [Gordonia polyisoprenivorans]WCB38592.1 TetR/AcrR family transcriptional regulator [Gordonia polyisoprenivorans]
MDGANIERRQHIVDVAIRILNDGGVDALNMRHLAAELHLRPMAVYYYVPNKSALLTMVLGEVVQRVVWSRYSGPPARATAEPVGGPLRQDE